MSLKTIFRIYFTRTLMAVRMDGLRSFLMSHSSHLHLEEKQMCYHKKKANMQNTA